MIELKKKYDIIIVGAGVAGLNCALNLPRDKNVLVVCTGKPTESDSYLAQGGICVLRGQSDYDGYFEDTMRAGHYENNPETVSMAPISLYSDFGNGRMPEIGFGGPYVSLSCFAESLQFEI